MLQSMGTPSLADMARKVRAAVLSTTTTTTRECTPARSNAWTTCKTECEAALRPLIQAEVKSTAYMLCTLANSVMSGGTQGGAVQFKVTGELTGVWDSDAAHIHMAWPSAGPARLIMGFGPSAAGKTYWAKSLLTLFASADPGFPNTFMCIDGGIHRSSSLVYTAIVHAAKQSCMKGLDNLVLSGVSLSKSLFSSGAVKRAQLAFLKQQQRAISLYVPETLGDCGWGPVTAACPSKYAAYLDITGDHAHWIGLLIWQHKTAAECDQPARKKCVGCTESGTAREATEGKRYSNSAYKHSMLEGIAAMHSAPGGRYMIHNAGAAGRTSVFRDLTTYHANTRHIQAALRQAQATYAFQYVA